MTAAMKLQNTCIQYLLGLLMTGFTFLSSVSAQGLHIATLANGSEFILVAQPLADATTVAWPATDGGDDFGSITSGSLTLVADLDAALGGEADESAPAIVVAVGGAAVSDLKAALDRLFDQRAPAPVRSTNKPPAVEGRLERRLGSPGSDATIRLEIALPAPDDLERSAAEVLWDLVPDLLGGDLEGLRSRIDDDRALLEARSNAEVAEMAVSGLRLGLARIAESPNIRADAVHASVRRLEVRRAALLESHPEAAHRVLDLWLSGGDAALREFLFAAEGVTLAAVRNAAMTWLPRHPGNVVLTLPPRTFNPRFASPPQIMQLENGLTAAVLERPGTQLATMCMRPVVVPDLDNEMAAAVLSRIARELRDADNRPGWVRVGANPPQLELALPADGFAELGEVLQSTLATVARDTTPVLSEGGDARRRAIRMMAGLLGVAEGTALSPASLLEGPNIALGIVATDGESAAEALRKFWAFSTSSGSGATVRSVDPVPKTREAAPGRGSVLVVALNLAIAHDEVVEAVFGELLRQRAEDLLPEGSIEVLHPFVPGHKVLLLVATADTMLDDLEGQLDDSWKSLIRPATDDELGGVRRLVAARSAAEWSGSTGRARRGAAVAAGVVPWRTASELEMATLSVSSEIVNNILQYLGDWRALDNTGAGLLPIVEIEKK